VIMKWYVRRMNGERGSNTNHLQIVETRTLGPNRSLAIVRVGAHARRLHRDLDVAARPLQR